MFAIVTDLRRRISKNIAPIGTSGEYAYSSPQALMVPATVNEDEMSAEFVIVSKVEDREYDVITPQGCEEYLDEYRRNPVVLLEHDALKPIGLSTDKAGVFHFRVLADRIIAKCFFHCLPLNGENLSEEVFRLVTKGVFRGASPGFLPIRGRKRGYGKDDGYEYHAWRLTEWSITSQPVNQDALRLSLGGVRCKSLRRTLESLVIKPSPVVRGGFVAYQAPNASVRAAGAELKAGLKSAKIAVKKFLSLEEAKSMSKPKTASIEFDKSIFKEEKAAVAWLDQHGYDSSSCVPLPASFVFKQRGGKLLEGKKSLATGVWALQTKAFGKDDEKDKDDDEEKDKKDDKPNDMADEKVEKADEKPDEDDDDEIDDVEDGDAEDADADNEGEEAEGEEAPVDEATDPAQMKADSEKILDLIAHTEMAIEHMKGSPELFAELLEAFETATANLRDTHKTKYADQMVNDAIEERKAGATAKEDMPADSVEPTDEQEMVKALRLARTGLEKTAKSIGRAVA